MQEKKFSLDLLRNDDACCAHRAIKDGQYKKAFLALMSIGLHHDSELILAAIFLKIPPGLPHPNSLIPLSSKISEAVNIKVLRSFAAGTALVLLV